MWFDGMEEYEEIVTGKTREERIEEQRKVDEIIENIKENGTLWQKFRLWSILNLGI